MRNNYASSPWISSHCFGECYLKLWTKMFYHSQFHQSH
jgi:hypothetical protein